MNLESNRPLVIHGWKTGFNKVQFTMMQQTELGLGLSEAKSITDKILDGQRIELTVRGKDYARIASLACELGATVATEEAEPACQ